MTSLGQGSDNLGMSSTQNEMIFKQVNAAKVKHFHLKMHAAASVPSLIAQIGLVVLNLGPLGR
jgi:hypothetical protein